MTLKVNQEVSLNFSLGYPHSPSALLVPSSSNRVPGKEGDTRGLYLLSYL